MTTSESTNSSRLPIVIGAIDSSVWTIVMSDVDRLMIWPVDSSSWRLPSSRVSAANTSLRRSCWTSKAIRPPSYRRTYDAP